jgi:hypothetical protein
MRDAIFCQGCGVHFNFFRGIGGGWLFINKDNTTYFFMADIRALR